MLDEVFIDRVDEVVNAGKGPASYRVDSDVAEEALDHVEPRRAGRCEVNVETRVLFQPGSHRCVFVGRVVVAD